MGATEGDKSLHKAKVYQPRTWKRRADELWSAAEVLQASNQAADASETWKDDLIDEGRAVELMLRGMAYECYLKCIRIAKRGLWRPSQPHGDDIGNRKHDLIVMGAEAGFDFTSEQAEVCGVLGTYLRWRGRYPAALSAAERHSLSGWWEGHDFVVVALHLRIEVATAIETRRANVAQGFSE
jgi:hypothetical protein